jgi:hypothetical protein
VPFQLIYPIYLIHYYLYMISETEPVNIYLLIGYNTHHSVAITDLDTTIGDIKTYIRRNLVMNASEWPDQVSDTYNLELFKSDNLRNLKNSETLADLICEGDLYNNECINLHIKLNNRKKQCFITSFFSNVMKSKTHHTDFPEQNHNYLFSWGT